MRSTLALALAVAVATVAGETLPMTVSAWTRVCVEQLPCWDRLSYLSDGSVQLNDRFSLPRAPKLKTFLPWNAVLARIKNLAALHRDTMGQPGAWFGDGGDVVGRINSLGLLDFEALRGTVAFPFVQKLLLPEGAVVAVFGDLHGSLHSLLREINTLVERGYLTNDFRVAPDWEGRFFMLFLGDYVDRGAYGVEVIFTLLELKLKNPTQVFMSRGNHEDEEVNKKRFGGTFDNELRAKFPGVPYEQLRQVYRLYDMLPLAIFVGRAQNSPSDPPPAFIQACHGGLEVGWNPRAFLLASPNDGTVSFAEVPHLWRRAWLEDLPPATQAAVPDAVKQNLRDVAAEQFPSQPSGVYPFVGWLWSDFTVHDQAKVMDFSPGRGFVFGRPITEQFLEATGVIGVLRAHQHNNSPRAGPMMSELRSNKGVVNNWGQAGLVYTFLSGTECPGFDFHHDSFGLLTLGTGGPRDWGLHHCSHETSPQAVTFNGRWFGDLTPPLPRTTWEATTGANLRPTVEHVCPMEFHFQCRKLAAPFRAL